MFFKYFFLSCCIWIGAYASFKDGIDYFNEGNYEKARTIFSTANFRDNIRAQLYRLASQGFEAEERADVFIGSLKLHLQAALESPTNEDHLAAQLVQAFWNAYSPNSHRRNLVSVPHAAVPSSISALLDLQDDDRASSLASVPLEASDALFINVEPVEESHGHSPSFPSMVRGAPRLNISGLREYMDNAEHFPFPALFEGVPREQAGIDILETLARARNMHGLYFLGSFLMTREEGGAPADITASERQRGFGCIGEAAVLKHTAAQVLMDEIAGRNTSSSWSDNCECWFAGEKPKEASCVGCRGDSRGEWCYCGWGVFGFGTRWSFADVCSNLHNISRTTREHLATVSGSVLILLQQLQAAGAINFLGQGQQAAGGVGLAMVLLSYLSAQNKEKEE